MAYNIGDKFIIEIGARYRVPIVDGQNIDHTAPTDLYKIRGFKALVFDEDGLKKLPRYKEEPTTKWVFCKYNPMDRAYKCKHCNEEFGVGIVQYDYCPKCGEYNGKREL